MLKVRIQESLSFDRVLFALLSLSVIVFIGWGRLRSFVVSDSDLAADMLLVDRIHTQGYLLVGHYSRFGFNNLGPFFLYVNWIFEGVVYGLLGAEISRFQIWTLSAICFNFVCVLALASMLSEFFSRRFDFWFSLLLLFILVGILGPKLVSAWMPDRVVLPFFCFIAASLLAVDKKNPYFVVMMFFAGVVSNGYITTIVFVAVILAVLFISWLRLGALQRQDVKVLTVGGAIFFIFLIPCLVDFVVEHPSNVEKIISAQLAQKFSTKPSLVEVEQFVRDVFFVKSIAALILFNVVAWPVYREKADMIPLSVKRDCVRGLSLSPWLLCCIIQELHPRFLGIPRSSRVYRFS